MPTRGKILQLGVLALLRHQHLLGWDCVLPRKAAAHSGHLISTRTSCGPASSAGRILGPLRGCLEAQETNPGLGLERTWRILQPSRQPGGFGGTSGHQQQERAEPWKGSAAPSRGTVACTYVTSCPQHCVSPSHSSPGTPRVVTCHTLWPGSGAGLL